MQNRVAGQSQALGAEHRAGLCLVRAGTRCGSSLQCRSPSSASSRRSSAKRASSVFSVLWIFLAAMLAGLAIHALIYYPLVAWLVGKKSPKVYLGQGADAIMTAAVV